MLCQECFGRVYPTSYAGCFISEHIINNFDSGFKETKHSCALWNFSIRLKYDQLFTVTQTQINVFEKYLSHPNLSWNISYIIRKLIERNDQRISENIWSQLIEIINNETSAIGTCNNAFHALSYLFSSPYSSTVSSICRQRLYKSIENILLRENISLHMQTNATQILNLMVIHDSYIIPAELSRKLNDVRYTNDLSDRQNSMHLNVRIQKLTTMQMTSVEQTSTASVEAQSEFIDMNVLNNTHSNQNQSIRCRTNVNQQRPTNSKNDQLHFLHDTPGQVHTLLRLARNNQPLHPNAIDYLIEKFALDAFHWNVQSYEYRTKIYKNIALTFKQTLQNGQTLPRKVIELTIKHLDEKSNIDTIYSEILLEFIRQNHIIEPKLLRKIQNDILPNVYRALVRKNLLDVLRIHTERGNHHITSSADLVRLENDLLDRRTSLSASRLFSYAASQEIKISGKAFTYLCCIVSNREVNSHSLEVRRFSMKAICYSINKLDKIKSLLPALQYCLIKAFEDSDEKICSLALQTLCFCCQVKCIKHIHPSILNDSVHRIWNNGIENQSVEHLKNLTLLYFQAAKEKYLLTRNVIVDISRLLEVSDFTVRKNVILTLKYISEQSMTTVLPSDALDNVEIALDDVESDIRSLAVHVFTQNWRKNPSFFLRTSQTSITKLFRNRMDVQVQNLALEILHELVKQKHQLSNELLETITLCLPQSDLPIVNFFIHYVEYHPLTQNILQSIEQAFPTYQNHEQFIDIFQKCVSHQLILTERTLFILGDLLFESTDEIIINKISSTLTLADRNQIIPELINDLLKNEYFIQVLIHSECEEDIKYSEQQLIDATSNGQRLANGILNSLQNLLSKYKCENSILKMILNVTLSGQNLPNNLMNILSNQISQTNQILLIKIFANIISNHQIPPENFLVHLKNFILDSSVNTDVIFIYTILFERNTAILTGDIIDPIYQLLEQLNQLNAELKRYLSVFVKLAIQNDIKPPRSEILIQMLTDKVSFIWNNAIQMIDDLARINPQTLDDNILISLSTMSCDDKVQKLFETIEQIPLSLPAIVSQRLTLARCSKLHEDINLLKQFKSTVLQGQQLSNKHLSELSNLLYSSNVEHRILASEILQISSTMNQTMPEDVIETIFATIEDEAIQRHTLPLLEKVGRICPENISRKTIEKKEILSDQIEQSFQLDPTSSMNFIQQLASQRVSFQNKTIEILVHQAENDCQHALSILGIIAEYQLLPSEIIRPYLKKKLQSDNQSEIRSTFLILRYQILQNSIDQPIDLLQMIALPSFINQNRLIEEISSLDEYLNLIHTLLSVEYFNQEIFQTYPVEQWSRACLLFDLRIQMNIDKESIELYTFCHNLAELEKSQGYAIDDILRFFLDKHSELNLPRINEILVFLDDISIDLLNSNDSNWYKNLVQCYIREKLVQHFPLSKYSSVLLNHLTDVLVDFYQIYQSISILNLCPEPDVLMESLRRISKEKLTMEELNEILFLAKKTPGLLSKQLDLMIIKNKLYAIWKSPLNDLKKANELLQQISTCWSFVNLFLVLDCAKEKSVSLTNFIQCLIIINDYRVKDDLVQEILASNLCSRKVFTLVIKSCFPKSDRIEKSKEQLMNEILTDNQSTIRPERLSTLSHSNVENLTKSWTKKKIQKWSERVQNNPEWAKNEANLSEIIAVIEHAIYLNDNYQVRHVQLMAVLLLLDTNEKKRGRLAEVATGEGKTTLISILAIIKALQGFYVDIVTSSSELAQRDARSKAKLYEMFNLTVSHNSDERRISTSSPKECYQCSIVYGDVSQYQFDILRDEFCSFDTRHKRPFDVVIIDEVDSMLIDENHKITRLAENLPGMEYLNPLFNAIHLVMNNCSDQDIFFKGTIIHELKRLILEPNSQLTIPQHLRTYVLSQLPHLIDSHLVARENYQLDHQYVIKSDENNIKRIVPIDYSNTGVVQSNTTLDDGLQQCLQIKHGLKITPLDLTTNFLSNLSFFDRYKSNLYGLTGTLGSNEAKQLLCDVYSVDTIIIPQYKVRRRLDLPTIILNSEDEWIKAIVQSSLTEIQRNRSVLIICQTRMHARTIDKHLRRHVVKGSVKLYTDNTDSNESHVVHTRASSGDIIVATNLAGRGTDLKTSQQVEENGGLHVCLTYMPINLRVEQQALGRTSRQGNRGTTQMILYKEDVIENREQTEKIQLDQIRMKDIPEIKANDKLYRKFCQLKADLRDDDSYKLASVKERWALWFKENDRRKQVKLSLIEKAKRVGLTFLDENSHSFYHVINQQLRKNLADEDMQTEMIEYILQNPESPEDLLVNLHNETWILYVEETMIQSLTQMFNINIVLLNSYEDLAILYKSEYAIQTVYIAGEFDHGYYTLELIDQEKFEQHTFIHEYKGDTGMKSARKQDQSKKKLHEILSKQNHVVDYAQFEQNIHEQYEFDEEIIQNPFYLMAKADMLIGKSEQFLFRAKQTAGKIISFGRDECTDLIKARRCLDAAIGLDPIYSFPARVNRAYLLIKQRANNYKELAKIDLCQARDLITDFILPGLLTMKINPCQTKENPHRDYDEFDKQLAIKIEFIQSYYAHIENAILEIENSQKLVDLVVSTRRDIVTERKLLRPQAFQFIQDLNLRDEMKYRLTFRSLCIQKNTNSNSDQCQTLIKLVNKDDYQHISIQFEGISTNSGKEIVQSFQQIVQYVNLRVDCLNKEEVSTLFHCEALHRATKNLTIKCQDRQQYEEILQLIGVSGTINLTEKYSRKFSRSNQALNYLNCNEHEQILSLFLTSMRTRDFELLMEMSLDDAIFSIIFHQLTSIEAENLLAMVDKQVFLEFENLEVKQASEILKIRQKRDFFISLDHHDIQNARRILSNFKLNIQDVSAKRNSISEKYLDDNKPCDELAELDQNGINQFIIINELNPIPWVSILAMTAIGTAQIAAGIYLVASTGGLGGQLGSALIVEGVSDLYLALRGAMSREINWQEYAVQKSISLTQSLLTIGIPVLAKSAQAAQAIGTTTTTTTQFVKQTFTQMKSIVRTDLLTVSRGVAKGAMKQSFGTACKQVVGSCAKHGASEILGYSTDAILNKYVLSQIQSGIEKHVDASMSKFLQDDFAYQRLIQTMFFNDSYNQNHQYQYQIEQMAANILNASNQQPIERVLSSIENVLPTILGQFEQNDATTKNLSAVLNSCQVFTNYISQLAQVESLVQNFFEKLKKKIETKRIPDPIELLSKETNIERDLAEMIFHTLRSHQIFDENGLINRNSCLEDSSEQTVDYTLNTNQQFSLRKLHTVLNKLSPTILDRDCKIRVEDFFNRILNNTYQNSIFEKTIQKIIVNHYMGVLLAMIVEPLKRHTIKKLIQLVGDPIERKLDANNQTIAERIRCEGEQRTIRNVCNELLENVQSGKFSISLKTKEQLESIAAKPSYARNAQENFIFSILENESGGYIELGLISAMTGEKYSVLTNEQSCDQAKPDGTIKLLRIESQTSCQSSWKLAGSKDERSSSLYDVVHRQLSDRFSSSQEIRVQLAEFMCQNPTYINRIQSSINIINANSNPIHRKQLLMGSQFSSVAPQTNFEIKLNGLMDFQQETIRTFYKTTKTLTKWIRSEERYIKLLIKVAQRLFPDLITPQMAAIATQTVTLIKTTDILFDECEEGNVIKIIRRLHETGQIAIELHKIAKK